MADMGTPMSTGFSGGDLSKEDIVNFLTQIIRAISGNTSAFRRTSVSGRSATEQPATVEIDPKDLKSIKDAISRSFDNLNNDIERTQDILKRMSKNDPQRQLHEQLMKLHNSYMNAVMDLNRRVIDARDTARQSPDKELERRRKGVEIAERQLSKAKEEHASQEKIQDLEKKLSARYKFLSEYIDQLTSKIIESDTHFQKTLDLMLETDDKVSKIKENIKKLQQMMKDYEEDYHRQLYNYSSDISVAGKLYKDRSLSKYEKFEQALSGLIDYMDSAIDAYDEQIEKLSELIENDKNLNDEEKAVLNEQKKQLQEKKKQLVEDRELVNKQTYLSNVWKQAGEELKEAGKKFKDAIGNLAIDTIVNRFVDPMKEGFQKVYESIESTRNEISARLRLNSGDYKALEETIFSRIDEAGLTGSVSSVDVNNMMSELVKSGITDQDLLVELATQSAKLKAGGSGLDLLNEETLQNLLVAQQNVIAGGGTQQDFFSLVEKLVDTQLGTESVITDEFGNILAISNGQSNKILNEILSSNNALGISFENSITDLSAGLYTAGASYSQGINADAISQIREELLSGKITDSSPLMSILRTSNMTLEDLSQLPVNEAYAKIADTLKQIVENIDPNYLTTISDVYGINMQYKDLLNLQKASKPLTVQDMNSYTDLINQKATQVSNDIKEGNYLSKTQQVNIAAQNKDIVENGALAAEQLYEGDELVKNGFQAVENGIRDVVAAIGNATKDTISAMFGGTQVGSLLGSGKTQMGGKLGQFGQTASDFLTGAKGTTAGAIGNAAGYAVGGGIATAGVAEIFKESLDGATEENIDKIAVNENLWTGAGTILGTAVAGPLGAAIGGVVGNTASKILSPATKWIYDHVTDMEDPAQDLLDAAGELYDSATLQMDVANKQLQEIEAREKYDKDQQRLYLAQQGVENAYTLSDAELEKAYQTQLNKEKQIAEGTYNEAANAKSISGYMSANAQNINSLLQDINSYNAMGYDLPGGAQHFITSRLGGAEKAGGLLRVLEDTGNITKAFDMMGIEDAETRSLLRDYYSTYLKNKDLYDTKQKEFENKWDEAKRVSTDPNSLQAILTAYINNNTQLNGNPPDIQMDGVSILSNDAGYPMLDTDGGTYANVGNLKFRTGLTNVPYDNYPALLHTGERILTKEEAKAYNKFSSLAVESLANEYSTVSGDNISSNVFNTAQYGMSDVKTAITSQTNTVESLLNQILQAISTLAGSMRNYNSFGNASSNVIRGNSNVMQLNTM